MPDYCMFHKNTLWGGVACPQCDAEEQLLTVLPDAMRPQSEADEALQTVLPDAIKALLLRLDIITVILQNIAEAMHVSQEYPDDEDTPHADP